MSVHRSCSGCGSVYTGPIACPECGATGTPLPNDGATWLRRELLARNPDAMLIPGFEPALVGYAQLGSRAVALYCRRRLLNTLLANGMPPALSVSVITAADDRTNPNAPLIVDLNESENEQLRVV